MQRNVQTILPEFFKQKETQDKYLCIPLKPESLSSNKFIGYIFDEERKQMQKCVFYVYYLDKTHKTKKTRRGKRGGKQTKKE
tara:strand:- start:718 stop:963 length:246 start_codon:yes stop_codon:yes gene_type:complete